MNYFLIFLAIDELSQVEQKYTVLKSKFDSQLNDINDLRERLKFL